MASSSIRRSPRELRVSLWAVDASSRYIAMIYRTDISHSRVD